MDGGIKEQRDNFFQPIITAFLIFIKSDLLCDINALITIKLKGKTPTNT